MIRLPGDFIRSVRRRSHVKEKRMLTAVDFDVKNPENEPAKQKKSNPGKVQG